VANRESSRPFWKPWLSFPRCASPKLFLLFIRRCCPALMQHMGDGADARASLERALPSPRQQVAPLVHASAGGRHGSYRVPLHYQPYDFVNQEFGTPYSDMPLRGSNEFQVCDCTVWLQLRSHARFTLSFLTGWGMAGAMDGRGATPQVEPCAR
jgi:hypothetical protein